MKQLASAVALLATSALALASDVHPPFQPSGRLGNPGNNGIHFVPSLPVAPNEDFSQEVEMVNTMSETDLKQKLLSELESLCRGKDVMSMWVVVEFCAYSLEAVKKVLKEQTPKDPVGSAIIAFMDRHGYLFVKLLEAYSALSDLRSRLGDHSGDREEYKKLLDEVEKVADRCRRAGGLHVAFLRQAAQKLRSQWGEQKEGRQHNILRFFDKLASLFESELIHFHAYMALLHMENPPEQYANPNQLQQDPKYRHVKNLLEATALDVQRKSKEATRVAAASVHDGLLPYPYLHLLFYRPPTNPDDLDGEDDGSGSGIEV
ncbi:hypothetical protein ACSSS7_005504 [Eimeria intestinalis]